MDWLCIIIGIFGLIIFFLCLFNSISRIGAKAIKAIVENIKNQDDKSEIRCFALNCRHHDYCGTIGCLFKTVELSNGGVCLCYKPKAEKKDKA